MEKEIETQVVETPESAPDAQPETQGLSPEASREELERARKEAASYRAKLRAEEKARATAEAKAKEYEDKDKSELELAQAAAQAAEQRLAETEARLNKIAMSNKVMAYGATGPHAEYVAYQYEQASKDDAFDEEKFFASLKESQPYLFGATPRPPASGAPGSPSTGSGGSKRAELEARRQALIDERTKLRVEGNPNRRRREDEISGELYSIRNQLSKM